MRGFLVTGTDTGVGKTAVTTALLRRAREAGLDVGAMKPFESGCARGSDGELVPEDALSLWWAAGETDPLELVCPYRFEAPVAPGIAASESGKDIDWPRVVDIHRELLSRHRDGVIVEGAGGLLVPLDSHGLTTIDLARALDLPVLVVARNALGTLNHTALTVESIDRHGLKCLGVVLNGSVPPDTSSATNRAALERFSQVTVLAELPWVDGNPAESVRSWDVDVGALLGAG